MSSAGPTGVSCQCSTTMSLSTAMVFAPVSPSFQMRRVLPCFSLTWALTWLTKSTKTSCGVASGPKRARACAAMCGKFSKAESIMYSSAPMCQ